jgi:hypothetical protein
VPPVPLAVRFPRAETGAVVFAGSAVARAFLKVEVVPEAVTPLKLLEVLVLDPDLYAGGVTRVFCSEGVLFAAVPVVDEETTPLVLDIGRDV